MEGQTMETEALPMAGMMEWAYWLMTFQGVLSIVSLTIIIACGTSLFRDWRRSHKSKVDVAMPEQK